MPFYSISGSDFVEMFVGVGASRVRDLFEQAKQNAPAIIFVDEIDAVGRHRGAGMGGGHDEREQTLNQLLVEMDGFDVKTNVILIAATNRPDILDPALLRPGRFDRQITVEAPDMQGRLKILQVHGKGKPLADVDLEGIARRTPGFTGADLANVLNEAALLTARAERTLIDDATLDEAIDRVMAGPQKRTRLMNDKERLITAYHEGGHALVAASLPNTDPVAKITILPRGRALGYTMVLPTEDKYSTSRNEMLDQLAYALGGRVAEELVFHDPTSGAANDIEKATGLARKMVTQFGMSEEIGAIKLGSASGEMFLGRDMGHERDYSESVAATVDREVRRLIEAAHDEAWEILVEHRPILDRLVKELLEKETLNAEQIKVIFADVVKRQPRRCGCPATAAPSPTCRPVPVPPRPAINANGFSVLGRAPVDLAKGANGSPTGPRTGRRERVVRERLVERLVGERLVRRVRRGLGAAARSRGQLGLLQRGRPRLGQRRVGHRSEHPVLATRRARSPRAPAAPEAAVAAPHPGPAGLDGRARDRLHGLDRPVVLAVLNVTPDSFSDGGLWSDPDAAVHHGLGLVAAGADAVDVGGESTRPGAERVPEAEELHRTVGVVRTLAGHGVPVSIDTMRARVAEAALEAGAVMVNDVSGGAADPAMARVVAEAGCPFVVMHWRGHSAQMAARATYDDVVAEVRDELCARVEALVAAGLDPARLVLDPGIGFAKDAGHGWALLAHLEALDALGFPLLVGVSRKRFLGALLAGEDGAPRPVEQREDASHAVAALLAAHGVWAVRAHTARPTADAVRVGAAWRRARDGAPEQDRLP